MGSFINWIRENLQATGNCDVTGHQARGCRNFVTLLSSYLNPSLAICFRRTGIYQSTGSLHSDGLSSNSMSPTASPSPTHLRGHVASNQRPSNQVTVMEQVLYLYLVKILICGKVSSFLKCESFQSVAIIIFYFVCKDSLKSLAFVEILWLNLKLFLALSLRSISVPIYEISNCNNHKLS
jgi:hypothetical protein